MPIQTVTMRNALVDAYKAQAAFAALYTTAPGASAGTEVTGGTYARLALSWGATSASSSSVTVTFNVPAGVTVVGAGIHTLVSGGVYLDGGTVTSQNFATAGTFQVTFTFTQA